MRLVTKRLADYLGSDHSAVGFLLAILSVPAALIGTMILLDVQETVHPAFGIFGLLWAAVALPLGFSMKSAKPHKAAWMLAVIWLAIALVSIFTIPFLKGA